MRKNQILNFFNFLKTKGFWSFFIPFVGLIITLSPRPIIVLSVDNENSRIDYVSTELKNIGSASAFDFKYNLFPEIKLKNGQINLLENPQNPLFGKGSIYPGQIYQGGRRITLLPGMETEIGELLVRYEIKYKYSLFSIPILDVIRIASKIDGLLVWNGKKWDTR